MPKRSKSTQATQPQESAQLKKNAPNSGPQAASPSILTQLQQTAGNRAVAQLMQQSPAAEPAPVAEAAAPASGNRTGMPDKLKSGMESLSGISMNDVKVHYGSSKPAELDALAYAQGNNIFVGPGQEKHLPHEAWHVVQQKQGRVKPSTQLKGVNVNDNPGLEREADRMGAKAASYADEATHLQEDSGPTTSTATAQLFKGMNKSNKERLKQSRIDSGNQEMQLDHSVSQHTLLKFVPLIDKIRSMVIPKKCNYTETKDAYERFEAKTGKPVELENKLLNLENNLTPGFQKTTGNPGSTFDPQIEMDGNISVQTDGSQHLFKLDNAIRKLSRLPILTQTEALESEDANLDQILGDTLNTITDCILHIQAESKPKFDSDIWYSYSDNTENEEKHVKRVSAKWLEGDDRRLASLGSEDYPTLSQVPFQFTYDVPTIIRKPPPVSTGKKKKNQKPEIEFEKIMKKVDIEVIIPVTAWKHIYDRHYIPTFKGDIQAINTFWKKPPIEAITAQLLSPEIQLLFDRNMENLGILEKQEPTTTEQSDYDDEYDDYNYDESFDEDTKEEIVKDGKGEIVDDGADSVNNSVDDEAEEKKNKKNEMSEEEKQLAVKFMGDVTNVNEFVDQLFFQGIMKVESNTKTESKLAFMVKSIAPQHFGLGYGVVPALLQKKMAQLEELKKPPKDENEPNSSN
ncbi:DUF4157 domain-containing protein [Paenibacillus sp. NEAU-GSW1]|nr:DUF4157 domain-containing protein [Paenibacillus sp. NEAU-GSW1]